MLEIIRFNEDEYDFPCLLVLGCFDGLHLGHDELLKKSKLQAKINGLDLGVMLFTEGKGGKQLYTFDERLAFLEKYNVKFVLKVDFNDEFKQIKPLEFLERLEDKLNVKAYMSGKDFRFGQGAKGKSSTLKSYAEDEENGVWYMPVKDLTYEGEKISSTAIKSLLEEGSVKKASLLLGRNYSVSGKVVHGADRGDKVLGYPTINVTYPENKVEVKQGVYEVRCTVGGQEYLGIANFGARPTFGEDDVVLEVYLDGFEGEVYDETVTVAFEDYIRDIVKFDSAEELSAQLSVDLENARARSEIAATDASDKADGEKCEKKDSEKDGETQVEIASEPSEENNAAAEPVTEEAAVEEVVETTEEVVEQEVAEPATEEPDEIAVEEATEEVTEEVTEVPADDNEVLEAELAEEAPVEEVVETSEDVTEEVIEEEITEEVPEEPEAEEEPPVEEITETEEPVEEATEAEEPEETKEEGTDD